MQLLEVRAVVVSCGLHVCPGVGLAAVQIAKALGAVVIGSVK